MPPATPLSASSALFRGIRGIFLCTSPKPQPRVTIRQYANRRSNGSRPNQDPRFEEFESGPRHQQYRSNPQYTRFGRAQTSYMLFRRWRARPTFKYEVGGLGGLGGLFYYANLETVPVTARRRFNIVSEAQEEGLADQMYQQVMQEYGERILPAYDVRTQKVERVLKRLLPSAQAMGMTEKDWKVHVIEDPQKNAFVIPGGKVFVFTGILPLLDTDDAMASVLGHEIAHNIARHSSERMSQSFLLIGIVWALAQTIGVDGGLSQMILDLAFTRPGSRKQESEADHIGLLMQAQSCYKPEAALEVHRRLGLEEAGHASPQWLSTHPASETRVRQMEEWLPAAHAEAEKSQCSGVSSYVDSFRGVIRDQFASDREW